MDMNFSNMTESIRLVLKKATVTRSAMQQLKEFFKGSGIRTVFVRSDRPAEQVLNTAKLLQDDFKVLIECDAKRYSSMKTKIAGNGSAAELLPVFDIGDNPANIGKIVAILPARKDASFIFIKNDDKIVDKGKLKKAFSAIIKAAGGKNIKFYWDCGFVLCAFSDNELGYFIQKGSEIQFCCPSYIEVDDSAHVRVCDKLKKIGDLGRAAPGQMLLAALDAGSSSLIPYKSFGVNHHCNTCRYFNKACTGGCKADIIKSFR